MFHLQGTRQFDKFDKTKDRSDILAIDESGRLVVVELKRDADSTHDLQALRYAAYCARFGVDDVLDLYIEHRKKSNEEVTRETARERLVAHVVEGDIEVLEEDLRPRIILVSRTFRVEVTSTCLWLREQYRMDVSCIQLMPYKVGDQVLLASSVLIPLPEAAAYTIQRDKKLERASTKKRLDWPVVRQVMAAIPTGCWMSYQDLAVASGGSAGAGMAVGGYLANTTDMPAGVHRVMRSDGTISPNWQGATGGPEECRARLETEGLKFDSRDRADPAKRWMPAGDEVAGNDEAVAIPSP